MTPVLGFDRNDLRLLMSFTRMYLRDRYLGSVLGSIWAVANPLMLLGLFTFVFGYALRVPLEGREGPLAYTVWLISAYGPWLAIADSLGTSTSSVVGSSALVKNITFKSELLPIAGAFVGSVPLVVSFVFLLILLVAGGDGLSVYTPLALLYVAAQFVFVSGLGLVLAAVNVFVRDVALALPNILFIILFASPVFYPMSSYPDWAQAASAFNPIHVLMDGYRQTLVYQDLPSPFGLLYLWALSAVLFWFGLRMFRRVKSYFESRL